MAQNIRVADVNLIVISGRLTRDPEVRYTAGGKAVARVRIANSRRFLNQTTNEWQEEATFVDVSIWGDAAERAKDRLRRGSPVLVEGRIQSEEWQAKDGTKRSGIKITARRVQFLEAMAGADSAPTASPAASDEGTSETSQESAPPQAEEMEEVAL